ncbi:MAG: NAD(P)H-hydrate dehydratase [Rhodobacteraceae bacterium]|nr:NAD(P)H-hydrate dehydratase [Paracoccaceae bacterium]
MSGRRARVLRAGPALAESLRKQGGRHKYSHGHALILSGPATRTGAARLAARGALRIGAGVVSLGCPQEAVAECAAQLTAIMLAPIEDGPALMATLQDRRINALCLGPALGVDDRGRGLVEEALGGVEPRPVVLDADALTILAEAPALFAMLHKNVVLTPHAGEFKRLFPDIMAKLESSALTGPVYSKVDATREAAKRAGCTVLFKGADTVIADAAGRAAINSAHYARAVPWLATAGSGDVLAGFITGLLARGFAPMQACEAAALLHVECALHFGPGLIAEDIPEQLPVVFCALKVHTLD